MSVAEFDIEKFIGAYGYFAIIVGTIFEGEATMLAAGVAARSALLQTQWVVAAGMLGTFISDIFCFCAGRWCGPRLTQWFPKSMARVDQGFRMIERYHDKLIVFHQFVPGMCTITPLAFGMSSIRVERFVWLNLLGNFLWTVSYTLLGYGAAMAWQRVSEQVPHSALPWAALFMIAIVLALLVHWIIRQARWKAQQASPNRVSEEFFQGESSK